MCRLPRRFPSSRYRALVATSEVTLALRRPDPSCPPWNPRTPILAETSSWTGTRGSSSSQPEVGASMRRFCIATARDCT